MKHRYAPFIMFALLLLSYTLNSVDRNLFSLLTEDVRQQINLTLPELGLSATIFTLGMGLAALPSSGLVRFMSRKNIVLLGLFIFSVATFLTGFAQGVATLLIYRTLSGVGEAIQVVALIAIGIAYFDNHRALVTSLISFSYAIGTVIGPAVAAILLKSYSWRMPFLVFGVVGVAMMLIVFGGVRPWFSEHKAAPTTPSGGDVVAKRARSTLKRYDTLWNPVTILLGGASLCAGLSVFGFFGLNALYLRSQLGFSPDHAAIVMGVIGIGGFSCPIIGWLGDRVGYYKSMLVAMPLTGISGAVSFMPLGHSVVWHAFFASVYGVAVLGLIYANMSAIIIDSMTAKKGHIASGVFISTYYFPAAFAGYLLGVLKDSMGWTAGGVLQSAGFAALSLICILAAHAIRKSATLREGRTAEVVGVAEL